MWRHVGCRRCRMPYDGGSPSGRLPSGSGEGGPRRIPLGPKARGRTDSRKIGPVPGHCSVTREMPSPSFVSVPRGMPTGCCCGPFQVRFVPSGLLPPVLLRLLEGQPRTGFELLKEVARRTEGDWTPGPAAVYPTLRVLEERGFVIRSPPSRGRARPYTLTPKGIRCMREWEKLRSEGRQQVTALLDLWQRL